MKTKQEVSAIITALKALYPDAQCSLDYGKDYELLFSVRLAAQCTDARVNLVTPALFARYPTLEAFAEADVDEVGQYIHSCGFWRAKARDIVASARMLREAFGGRVPDTMEQLLRLPGVGRKTANLVLGDIYGQEGYVCDTHCIRITGRLGLTDGSKDPLKVERQLRQCIPPEESNNFCHRMVLHGRAVCTARSPRCGECTLRPYCDWAGRKKLNTYIRLPEVRIASGSFLHEEQALFPLPPHILAVSRPIQGGSLWIRRNLSTDCAGTLRPCSR